MHEGGGRWVGGNKLVELKKKKKKIKNEYPVSLLILESGCSMCMPIRKVLKFSRIKKIILKEMEHEYLLSNNTLLDVIYKILVGMALSKQGVNERNSKH